MMLIARTHTRETTPFRTTGMIAALVLAASVLAASAGASAAHADLATTRPSSANPLAAPGPQVLAAPSVTLSLPEKPRFGARSFVNIHVVAGGRGAHGTLEYRLDGAAPKLLPLGDGWASATLPRRLPLGSHRLDVSYSGDATTAALALDPIRFRVRPAKSSVRMEASAFHPASGTGPVVSVRVRVAGTSLPVVGTVVIENDGRRVASTIVHAADHGFVKLRLPAFSSSRPLSLRASFHPRSHSIASAATTKPTTIVSAD